MARNACGIYEALWLARLHHASARSLYLHIPFCRRKCSYCDFSSWATGSDDPLVGAYLDALERLVSQAVQVGLLEGLETAYIGGGTPTLAGSGLVRLVADVIGTCPQVDELTCEANPDSLSDNLLTELPAAGCTRLSVGVQSLCNDELRQLGRLHDARLARERLEAAVDAGLTVSCDLMCATPGQTEERWMESLRGAVACGVHHLSVYPLQIEEGTPLDARYGIDQRPWNDSSVQAERMEQAASFLEAMGLHRYEVASYARTGYVCRHNQAYWTAVPYLGLGTSASSMLTRSGYERLRQEAPQLPALMSSVSRVRLTCTNGRRDLAQAKSLADLHFDIELLDAAMAAAEDLMLGMRLTRGVDVGLLAHARSVIGGAAVDEALAWCGERGLIATNGLAYMPTNEGWLMGNDLYGKLWDLAPGEPDLIHV